MSAYLTHCVVCGRPRETADATRNYCLRCKPPLPAKPEDVREELANVIGIALDIWNMEPTEVPRPLAIADAILAKYPNLKTPEGT